ncbi:CBN-MECR-1 protein [Aphelenchoides avenae]|nr:CBN-MECR-1 protein [Aphelenchus avenae]
MSVPVKRVIYHGHGDPEKVLNFEETTIDTSNLGESEAFVRWFAAPVNPSDLRQIVGIYGVLPSSFPAVPGNEAAGVVEKIGSAVRNLEPGDYVVSVASGLGTWTTHGIYDAAKLYHVCNVGLPTTTLATFIANPPTAYLLLKSFVELKKDDVVVQNGANSAVGKYVIQLAWIWGFKTLNVVRDRPNIEDVKKQLKDFGADEVYTEEEFKEALPGLKDFTIRLALDSVAGESSIFLASSLAQVGTIVSYGRMSGKPFQASVADFIFKDIHVRGFWVTRWYKTASVEDRNKMYAELVTLFKEGKLKEAPHTERRMEDFAAAVKQSTSMANSKQIFVFSDE